MALFNFPYINHSETPIQIQDWFSYLGLALNEAGHDVYFSRYVDGSAINVFIEAFGDLTTELLLRYAKMGVKIVVVATEAVTDGTFNDFKPTDGDTGWYGRHRIWDIRYRNFLKVAEACKTIWCVSQSQINDYAKVISPQWLHLMPFGYIANYDIVKQIPNKLKDIDFIFTGAYTKSREQTIRMLKQKGYKAMLFKELLPTYIRRNILARTKVCLGLKQYKEWKYSSLFRNFYHLMNGTFMLAEKCEIPSIVDDYIETADSNNFIAACIEAHHKTNLNEIAASNLDRFRQEVPLKPLFAKLLEQSLAN